MALTDNLVSYWPLDEASGTRADSVGTASLTDNNTVTQAAGKISTAALFTRANSEWLSYAGSAFNLSTTDDWSVSAWVYPVSISGYDTLISMGVGGDQKVYILIEAVSGQPARWDAGATGLRATVALSLNTWAHVVYTYTSGGVNTGTQQFYVDSVARGNKTGAVPAPLTGNLYIGYDGASGAHYMDGRIDELGFWRRALTATEVGQLYNSGAGLAYPLVPAYVGPGPRVRPIRQAVNRRAVR